VTAPTELERRVLLEVDAAADELVTFLQDLVRIPSVNPPGEYRELASFLATRLETLGLEAEVLEVPAELIEAAGLTTPRLNVLGRHGDAAHPCLVLNAHLDTVPVSGRWTTDPFSGELRDGRVYGRGASDSKGRIACYAYVLAALARAGFEPTGSILLVASADEETGGRLGVEYLLESGAIAPDYAIVEGQCHAVWVAANGCLHLRISIRGRAAHAATPERGIDAIEEAQAVLSALYAHRDELRRRPSSIPGLIHPTLIVGTIAGGTKTNVVPDEVVLTVDRRIDPAEDADAVVAELVDVVRAAAGATTVETEVLMLAHPYGTTPESARLAQALLRRGEQVLGERPALVGIPGFTDARFFWERGISTVNYGPAPRDHWSSNAHGGDEHQRVDDLIAATKVLALAALDLCGESL
jgi:acetylornithine deacetylase/succinyl-diaminopimelate desuccinylase family protein